MTLNEFKAFLEGYEASFVDGVPSAEQYVVIKDKLATVTMLVNSPLPLPSRLPDNLYPPKVYYTDKSSDIPLRNPATWTC